METIDEVLEHFGVKGMQWGVRRNRDSGGSGPRFGKKKAPATKEASQATKLQDRARKHGIHTLSNRELEQLTKRMNLEQQYTRLTGESPSPRGQQIAKKFMSGGGKFVGQVLMGVGQQQAKDVLNQHASKQLINMGIKAAKGGG